MTEFKYNHVKNISTNYTLFKLNYGYYYFILFKEKINSYSKSQLHKKLDKKLKELIIIFL